MAFKTFLDKPLRPEEDEKLADMLQNGSDERRKFINAVTRISIKKKTRKEKCLLKK